MLPILAFPRRNHVFLRIQTVFHVGLPTQVQLDLIHSGMEVTLLHKFFSPVCIILPVLTAVYFQLSMQMRERCMNNKKTQILQVSGVVKRPG
jgi:hypothetical protein